MADETITVRMSRSDGQTPWGFRLSGGSEYNKAIVIESVYKDRLTPTTDIFPQTYYFMCMSTEV